MNDDSSPSIPLNAEHSEARQAEIDQRRIDMKAAMSETELMRLQIIEDCVGKMEAAGIPFLMWAASDDPKEEDDGKRGWWQFNRMTPHPKEDYHTFVQKSWVASMSLFVMLMKHWSCIWPGTLVAFDTNNEHSHVFQAGKHYDLRERSEAAE